jgi:hypothetical protein
MNDQVQKVIRHPAAVPSGVGLLCFGVGVGVGFILGRRTKKSITADLHVLPNIDLDLTVNDERKQKLDTFVVKTEEEAILVINRMHEVIEQFDSITVGDLKDLIGLETEEGDEDWGWTELEYAMPERGKKGYMLIIPDPKALDERADDEGATFNPEPEVDKAVEAGRDFIKNRYLGLPDPEEIEEVLDASEDEASEEEEASDPEEETTDVENVRKANAFATAGDNWDLLKELRGRTESAPYVLHKDEFYANEKGYSQHSLTYYAGDGIMAVEDDDDRIVYNHDSVVGELKWGHGSGDPLIVYVRNDKFRAEYEITHVDGLFSVEVGGMDIPDNERVRNLEHSGEPRRFRDRTE